MEKKTDVVDEINAQRINIVEPDGTVRMTLFNSINMPPAIIAGQDIAPGHRQGLGLAGIMFYNNDGDECGGLIFNGTRDAEGQPQMGLSLTFDQHQQDQVLQFSLQDSAGEREYGISIFDRPDETIIDTIRQFSEAESISDDAEKKEALRELGLRNARRAFFGKARDGSIRLVINDSQGNPKFEVRMDAEDNLTVVGLE